MDKKILILLAGAVIGAVAYNAYKKSKKAATNPSTATNPMSCTGAVECKDFKCPKGYLAEWGRGVQMSAVCYPEARFPEDTDYGYAKARMH